MVIATWNVNSVRSRLPAIAEFVAAQQPDVLCMQETKVADDSFPAAEFEALDYQVAFSGAGSYSGVAIASRLPMTVLQRGLDDGGPADPERIIVAKIGRLPVVNTYVPQGKAADHPDFAYKLAWLARLREYFDRTFTPHTRLLWVGDLNVAPQERDVWDPKRLLKHPDFHPDARAAFAETVAWGFVDCFRLHNDEDGQFTFFDYRDTQSVARNRGWRVDHIMATRPLAKLCRRCWIDMAPRLGERPSDHTPLLAEFEV
ncbi:MAG: exodeoxyribonuclease III [Armatimonadota bacterium]